jgi:signal peptidase II
MRNKSLFAKYLISLFCVIAPVIIVDQLTKLLVFYYASTLSMAEQFYISTLPFLNIILVWNYGISFGIFNNAAQNQFLLLTVAFFICWLLFFIYNKKKKPSLKYPIGMIIGGAIGNGIDRLTYGAVLDFIDFHAWGYHYPAFNVADSAIVIGAVLLLFNKDM